MGSVAFYIGSLKKGGAERVFVNLATYFLEQGCNVTMVTQYKKENEYELPAGVRRVISDLTPEEEGGRIVNLSSVVGLRGNAGQTNYSASKAGLIGLSKSLAKELATRNVTVNVVAPGFITTDMTDALPEGAREALLSTIPMKRLGAAEDVARAVAFFAGEGAGYVTGQVLCVDGGMAV